MFSCACSNPNTKSDMYVINNLKKVEKKIEIDSIKMGTNLNGSGNGNGIYQRFRLFVLHHFERSCD